MKRIPLYLIVLLLTAPHSLPARETDPPARRAWEISPGGALINNTRISVADFQARENGYQFNLEDKHLYGGINFSVAHELNRWLLWDFRATAGQVRLPESSGEGAYGHSFLAGPGLQVRPFPGSKWIVPYIRLGVNYFHKDFVTRYFGNFDTDVTGTAQWTVVKDAWNNHPGDTRESWFPVSGGVGVIGWMSNRIGIGLQGEYVRALSVRGRNFAQGNIQLLVRLGGEDKRKSDPERIVEKRVEVPVERIVEKTVEVEKIVEKRVEIPAEKTLAELMENVHFAFDQDVLTGESEQILEHVATIIKQFPSTKFLIAGYTDARGTDPYNDDLSTRRARAVYGSLLAKGVPPGQITYRGFGKRRAVIPAKASEEDRAGDRKVVIETISNPTLWKYLNNNH